MKYSTMAKLLVPEGVPPERQGIIVLNWTDCVDPYPQSGACMLNVEQGRFYDRVAHSLIWEGE